jgi:hypothetical protein
MDNATSQHSVITLLLKNMGSLVLIESKVYSH